MSVEAQTITGLNPATEKLVDKLDRLYSGVRDINDPVTWRTLVIDLRELMGSDSPDLKTATIPFKEADRAVGGLIDGTHMEELRVPLLRALGYGEYLVGEDDSLDVLVVNARHLPEPLWAKLADQFTDGGAKTAAVNLVGHYADAETRIVNPIFEGTIDRMLLVASTQEQRGGSVGVLTKVMSAIKNIGFGGRCREIDVIIPMFGGSRGHKPGQDELVGNEVLEAEENALSLCLHARRALDDLKEKKKLEGDDEPLPVVRFFTVDIHNDELPREVFVREGFDFESISSAEVLADEACKQVVALALPLKVVACDGGAVVRTEAVAEKSLMKLVENEEYVRGRDEVYVDVVYMDKTRVRAGEVEDAHIDHIMRWTYDLKTGSIKKELLEQGIDQNEPCVVLYSDDMMDSGKTFGKDMKVVRQTLTEIKKVLFAASHAVLSYGVDVMDTCGADIYFLTNTLLPDGLKDKDKVVWLDMSWLIYNALVHGDSGAI